MTSFTVVGLEQTRAALEAGQVDTLVLWHELQAPPETRSQLISLATRTSADVEVVDDHPEFAQLGGVGALLRYKATATQPVILPHAPGATADAPGSQPTA